MARLNPQRGVLAPLPASASFVTLSLLPNANAVDARACLATLPADGQVLLGLGAPLLDGTRGIPGLQAFPTTMPLFPATQGDVWLRLSHTDASKRHDAASTLLHALRSHFQVQEEVAAFVYKKGRDLSGFKDGTENPKGSAASTAALVRGAGPGLDGGSFVLAQRWVHDLDTLRAMDPDARDHVVGRKLSNDKELPDAPPSAHVKRTAQENFTPTAFMVRRSMPYSNFQGEGLYFVAFVSTLNAPLAMLRRMAGREDGVVDALFTYSRAASGGFYWCPPLKDGRFDLRAVRAAG
jgi:putative iron-dependent peroxidase